MFSFRRIHLTIICLLVLGLSFGVQSQTKLTIEEAVSQALAQNPKLKAKEALVDAAKANIGIAKSLEDPMVGVEFYDVPINSSDVTRGMETNYSVIQKIPFPSKLATQGKAAEKAYQSEKSAYDAQSLNTAVAAEHAFHDLYFLERSLLINKELQKIWRLFVSSEEGRYVTGNETSQNFLKARVELDQLKSEAALLEAKKIRGQAALNILRHKNPSEPIVLAELPRYNHPFPSFDVLEKRLLEIQPELKAVKYRVDEAKAQLSLARQKNILPDFQTRFTYAQRFGQIDAWTAEAMINIPFLWGKNRKTLKKAHAMRRMADQERLSMEDEKLAMLKESYAQFESFKKSYDLYRTRIVPQAKIALGSAQSAYSSGKESFLNLMDTARQFEEAKLGQLESFVEYHKAITHLKWAVGEDFMENKK